MKYTSYLYLLITAILLVIISSVLIAVYYCRLPEEVHLYFNTINTDSNQLYPKWKMAFFPLIAGILDVILFLKFRNKILNKEAKILIILGLLLSIYCLTATVNTIANGMGYSIQFANNMAILLVLIFILFVLYFNVRL